MFNFSNFFTKKFTTSVLTVLGLGFFFGFAPQAFAQGVPDQSDLSWDGWYLGAEAGYNRADDNGLVFGSSDGAYFGGFLGYRKQFDNRFVLGIEGFGGSATNDETVVVLTVPVMIDVGRVYGVDGILGYAVNDKVLVFTSLGYVNVQLKASSVAAPGVVVSDSEGDIRFGGGVEVKFSDKVSGRIKGTYTEIGGLDIFSILAGIAFNF